ncbi:MAG: GNAT family N-acetyltransferase [Pyrinomonadaceae bacterium]
MSKITYRSATSNDIERLGTIAYEAFYKVSTDHNFPPDLPTPDVGIGLAGMVVGRDDIFSVVAENGKILGSNFLWEADEIDGVGPITVDPVEQNSSIGRELMECVIKRSTDNGKAGIRLVQAAYHNRSLALYTKLGFDVVEPLSAINGKPFTAEIPSRTVRTLTSRDVEVANKLCIATHGISRKNEIAGAAQAGSGLVVENNGKLSGYTTILGFFGHAVAESNDDLKALIGSGREIAWPGFLLPTRNGDVLRWCFENGLRIVMPLSLMSKGYYQTPRNPFVPSILY